MTLTPKEHPQWFQPLPPSGEDFITAALAAVRTDDDWQDKFIAVFDIDQLKIAYVSNSLLYADLQKNTQLTELLAEVGTSVGWLDRLLQRAEGGRKKIVIQLLQERLRQDVAKHIGKDSTYSHKKLLINDLQVIYALLTDQCPALKLTDAQRALIHSQLLSGVANCTAGFHNRVQEIIQSLKKSTTPPASIAEILAIIRDELVHKAAGVFKNRFAQRSHANNQFLQSNEIHLYNHFTLLAHQEGYGTQVTSHVDPFLLEERYVAEMRTVLSQFFIKNYTLFANLINLRTHIKSALSLYDYKNKKPAGESYTFGECQKFTAYLNQLCGLSIAEDSPEYMLKDDDEYLIDIDWPALSRKLWQKMAQDGYFKPSAKEDAKGTSEAALVSVAHSQFFEFLQPPSIPTEWRKPEEWEGSWDINWQGIPYEIEDRRNISHLLPFTDDWISCIEVFALNKEAQEKLFVGFFLPSLKNQSLSRDWMVLPILISNYKNRLLDIIWKYKKEAGNYFYGWKLNFDVVWEQIFPTFNFGFLEKMRDAPFAANFLMWLNLKKIEPGELLKMIGGLTQFRGFTNWIIKNMKFSKDIAKYRDPAANTLLHYAVSKGDVLAVKLLLALGADITAKNSGNHTVASLIRNQPVIKMLLAQREVELALMEKLETQDIHEYDDISLVNNEDIGLTKVPETLLMKAAKYGRSLAVKKLLAMGVPTKLLNDDGQTALDIAIAAGHVKLVALFLNSIDPAIVSHEKRQEEVGAWLKLAVTSNKLEIVRLLHSKFGDELFHEENMRAYGDGLTLLMIAAEAGNLDMVQYLIDTQKALIDEEMHHETALALAARHGHLAVVEALLAAGDSDYHRSECCKYVTPALVGAAQENHKDVFEKLLSVAVYVPRSCIRNETFDEEVDAAPLEEFPGEYAALIHEEYARRAAIFAAIERDDRAIDLSSLPAFCVDDNDNALLEMVVKKNRLDLVRDLLARIAPFSQAFALAVQNKNYAILREFLLNITKEDQPENFSEQIKILRDSPEGLTFVMKFCDEQPSSWLALLMKGASEPSQEKPHKLKKSQVKLPKPTPVIALKNSEEFSIKKTTGDGNCAFHAVFGVPAASSGRIFDAEHLEHREQLRVAVLSTTVEENPERYQIIQSCVLALLHEASINPGIFKDSPNLARLLRSYQANAAAEAEAEQCFRQAVLANPQVAGFIEEHCKDYIGPSGKKLLAFTDKYIHMKNNFKDEFEQLLDAEGLLSQYTTYQAFSLRDFSGDISASHIEEYARILGRPGQHLLAQEMNLLAQVFNKTITYYLGVEGGKTLPPVVFNAGCADVVAVRHNGVNHFERVEEGDKPQPRLDSKMSKARFFTAVPVASSDSVESPRSPSSASSGKRKREDSDVSAHGKQPRVDASTEPRPSGSVAQH